MKKILSIILLVVMIISVFPTNMFVNAATTNSSNKTCVVSKSTRCIKHKYTNNCDTTCNICKAKRSITHSYKATVTKATLKKNGSIVNKCKVCGKTAKSTLKYVKSFSLSTTTYTYNGKTKTPSVTVKDSAGKVLKKNTDYTVSYAGGRKNVGTYKVVVKMKGKYSGRKTLYFKINPISVSKCKLSLSTTSYTYNGKVKTPSVTVKNSAGKVLKKNTDYTVSYASGRKNVGTYKVVVKMKGKYSGTKTLYFKINPISVSKCKLSLSTTSYTYNGKVKTPSVSVKYGSITLKKNTDYTVSYASGRINVGTYKIVVKMKGNYSGTKTLYFKISPISVSKCNVSLSTTEYKYDGKVKTPSVSVKYGSTTLKKNTDYTVTYGSGRINVGTYKVDVKMKGNYSGTKTLYFKINPLTPEEIFKKFCTYEKIDGKIILKDVDHSLTGDFIIPSKVDGCPVTEIANDAFYNCDSLTSVTIPDSVTSIGFSAFSWCLGLENITVDENNQYYSSLDGVLFNKDKTMLIRYPEGKTAKTYTIPSIITSIGDYAFSWCDGLTSITIPDSVKSIGDSAFYFCDSLTSVTIGNGVTSIGPVAFGNCKSLTSITIPDSVKSIGYWAFDGCELLKDVYYKGTEEQRKNIQIDHGNDYLTSATWHYETSSSSGSNPDMMEGFAPWH